MKRIICILFALVFLLCGCISDASDPTVFSYKDVEQLSDFKCYISYNDEVLTIDGTRAKELYKLICDAMSGQECTPTFSDGDHVYMVFYNSSEDYPSEKIHEFYGTYTIYDDGLLVFSGSPYFSAAFDYKLEASLYDSVMDIIFGNN